jgi:shikimate kinase
MSIFQSRENLYSQADLRIQVKKENIEEVAMKIINAIHKEIVS